jgi:hypothetical protein
MVPPVVYMCVAPSCSEGDSRLGQGADILHAKTGDVVATMAVGAYLLVGEVKANGVDQERLGWCELGWLRLTTASGEVLMKPLSPGEWRPAGLVPIDTLPEFVTRAPQWWRASRRQFIRSGVEETSPNVAEIFAGTRVQLLGRTLRDSAESEVFLTAVGAGSGYLTVKASPHLPEDVLSEGIQPNEQLLTWVSSADGLPRLRAREPPLHGGRKTPGMLHRKVEGHDQTTHILPPSLSLDRMGLKVPPRGMPDARRFELRTCRNIVQFSHLQAVERNTSRGGAGEEHLVLEELREMARSACGLLAHPHEGHFFDDFFALSPKVRACMPLPLASPRAVQQKRSMRHSALPCFVTSDGHFCLFVNGPHHHLEAIFTSCGKTTRASDELQGFLDQLQEKILVVTQSFGLAETDDTAFSYGDAAQVTIKMHGHIGQTVDPIRTLWRQQTGASHARFVNISPAKAAATSIDCVSQIPLLPYVRTTRYL